MDDDTPPQPYKRLSSSQIYAAAFEARAISETRDKIARIAANHSSSIVSEISGELVRFAGVMLEAGERRALESHRAVIQAYLLAGGYTASIEQIQSRLPNGYSISQTRLAQILQSLGLDIIES